MAPLPFVTDTDDTDSRAGAATGPMMARHHPRRHHPVAATTPRVCEPREVHLASAPGPVRRAVAAGLAAGLLLAACASGGGGSADTDTSAGPSTTGPTGSTSSLNGASTTTGPTTATTAPSTTGTTGGATSTTTRPSRPCPADDLSPRDRLAQLVMVGADPAGTADATRLVTRAHVGGIFIGGNATGLLTSGTLPELRGPGGIAPFVAVDEEGGRVQRIDAIVGDAPSARTLGRTASLADIRALAATRGRAMVRLGITVDFAPVLDVTDQPDGAVIGDRSFGDDPATVVRNARAYAQGLRDAGILPVFKHFPGHGHATGDSHKGTATTPPLAQLTPDLAPYRVLLDEPGPGAVMVGHLVVPGLTDSLPASLSPAAIDGLLRRDLGWSGLVFTDELGGMAAVSARYGAPEAVRRALAAGADVALVARSDQLDAILDGLERAIADGTLPRSRADEALRHVLAAKGYGC
jgi:beta-N-acetylhexosaminidase